MTKADRPDVEGLRVVATGMWAEVRCETSAGVLALCDYIDRLEADPRSQGKRYYANQQTKEVHDLWNEMASCQIEAIQDGKIFSVDSLAQAHNEGYSDCVSCIGRPALGPEESRAREQGDG